MLSLFRFKCFVIQSANKDEWRAKSVWSIWQLSNICFLEVYDAPDSCRT